MTNLLLVILILLVLGVLVFLIVLAKRRSVGDAGEVPELRERLEAEQAARIQAETRLEGERKNLEEQRRRLGEDQAQLKEAFSALSADALKDSRTQFLSQADEKLRPIQSLLKDYEQKLDAIEKARNTAYGGLEQHLKSLASAHDVLQKEAHQLSTALRSPTVRGRWGEVTLRRVVELAGMSSYCDFDEQVSVETEEGRLRPDMTVRLPNDRIIIVDSKAPLEAYMDAVEASDEAGRKAALERHTQALRAHVRALCQKAYWSQFDNAPDFVVLFLPGESFFIAALEADRSLMEDAFRSNVVLASPATLFALLKAVATGWQEHALAENAEKIADVGRELYERVRVFAENFRDVGSGLRSAAKAYDTAVGSYLSRLEPGARKLAELGASSGKELPGVEPVEGPTRALPASPRGEPEAGERPDE